MLRIRTSVYTSRFAQLYDCKEQQEQATTTNKYIHTQICKEKDFLQEQPDKTRKRVASVRSPQHTAKRIKRNEKFCNKYYDHNTIVCVFFFFGLKSTNQPTTSFYLPFLFMLFFLLVDSVFVLSSFYNKRSNLFCCHKKRDNNRTHE